MQCQNNLNLNNKWDIKQLMASLQQYWQQLVKVINGNLTFGSPANIDNISGAWIVFDVTAPSVDIVLTHNLGRIPVGYWIMNKNQYCDFQDGTTPWTRITISIQGSVAGTTGYVFVV